MIKGEVQDCVSEDCPRGCNELRDSEAWIVTAEDVNALLAVQRAADILHDKFTDIACTVGLQDECDNLGDALASYLAAYRGGNDGQGR